MYIFFRRIRWDWEDVRISYNNRKNEKKLIVALATASSRIAAIRLKGGKTVRSAYELPC